MISASGADSITRVIHVQPDLSDNDFEIQRTVDEIIKGDYKRVKNSLKTIQESIFLLGRSLFNSQMNCYTSLSLSIDSLNHN